MNKQFNSEKIAILQRGMVNYRQIFSAAFLLSLLVALMFLSACNKSDNAESQTTTGFNMRMTDAPGNYDEVNVEIIGAEVHSDVNGWTALNINAGVYNLLDLTNGKDTLIADGQIAVGKVSQIRLLLGTNNTVVYEGKTYPLETPSGQSSGIKLKVNADLVAGINYTMLLDFDANKSIVVTGKDKFILKPVIRVVNKSLDGAITGTILPIASHSAVFAISGSDTFSTYADTLSGSFYIGGLKTSSYSVHILPNLPLLDVTINNVAVVNGSVTSIGTVTLK